MAKIESLRSFVNMWECDENNHMNVQFYWTKFQTADLHFKVLADLETLPEDSRAIRHVRYHSEAHAAEPLVVHTYVTQESLYPFAIAHEMTELTTGRLIATALDGYLLEDSSKWSERDHGAHAPLNLAVLPRSFDDSSIPGDLKTNDLIARKGLVTYRGQVPVDHCDGSGLATDRYAVHCATDGASHGWEFGGITKDWLNSNNYGRVAVEMRLSRIAPLYSHDLTHQVTHFTSVAAKTFSFRHHVFHTKSDTLVACIDLTALAMDLETRRAISWPDDIRQSIEQMVSTE